MKKDTSIPKYVHEAIDKLIENCFDPMDAPATFEDPFKERDQARRELEAAITKFKNNAPVAHKVRAHG